MKNISRLGVFVTILSVIILMLVNSNSMTSAIDYSNRTTDYLIAYRTPFILGNWYFRNILNLATPASFITNIQIYLPQFQQIIVDENVLKLIFDSNMNTPGIYKAYNENTSLVSDMNQLDLIFYIEESVVSLTNPPINTTNSDFLNFRQFLMPGFNAILTNIKYNLHNALQNYFSSYVAVEIYFILIKSVLQVIICLLIIKMVINFFERNQIIWEQIS